MVKAEQLEDGRLKLQLDDETVMGNFVELHLDPEDGRALLRELVRLYMGEDVAQTLDGPIKKATAPKRGRWWAALFGDQADV